MKCPKCSYISFDGAERCRNCGYDFALSQGPSVDAELPLQNQDVADRPAVDLPLSSDREQTGPAQSRPDAAPSLKAPAPATDLPLFDAPIRGVDDTPLITAPAPPRAPLSVRRAAGDTPRARPAGVGGGLGREALGRRLPLARETTGDAVEASSAATARSRTAASPPVAAARRVAAAALDGAILALIDVTVVYLTLRLTDLDFARIGALPLLPLAGFLALLNGGYLVGFTIASGQTIGKMVTGVCVVGETTPTVSLSSAVIRALGIALTVCSLGIGYAPVFYGPDRRALHDRLSNTRVVRR